MVTPAAKREAVAHLKSVHEMSERRACRVIGLWRWPGTDRLPPSSRASSVASCSPMRQSNHASQANGIPKRKSQASAASSRQTLQSRTGYCAENQFSFSRLTVVHRRPLISAITTQAVPGSFSCYLSCFIMGQQ